MLTMTESWNSNSESPQATPSPAPSGTFQQSEPANAEPQVEDTQEIVEEETEEVEIDTDRSNAGLFSWRDVALVSSFVQKYTSSSAKRQGLFQDLVQAYGDPIDIAQGIYPPNGVIHSTDFIISVATGTQNSTPSEAMRQGIALAATIGEMEVEEVRMVSKMINALLENGLKNPEGISSIRYRRNMPTHEVLDLFMEAIDNVSAEGLENLQWARKLLSIWPESA